MFGTKSTSLFLSFLVKSRFSFSRPMSTQHNSSKEMPATPDKPKTVGLVVIGDEILRGDTLDTNSHFICSRLYQLGLQVQRISVVPDKLDVIAEHVRREATVHDFVMTSGGVGPTHDDVTYAGVALAFGLGMARHPELVRIIEAWFGSDHSQPAFRMAEVPETARVVFTAGDPSRFPCVRVRNVYVLPGIPAYMKRSFKCVVDDLVAEGGVVTSPPITASLYVGVDEVSITEPLNRVVSHFGERVKFGSYPVVDHSFYRVRLSMESTSTETLAEAEKHLRDQLPAGAIVPFDEDPVGHAESRLFSAIEEERDDVTTPEDVRLPLRKAMSLLERCLSEYGPSAVCVSFNGGKDCTALLHMFYAAVRRRHPEYTGKLHGLFVRASHNFPEMEQFVEDAAKRYNLELHTVPSPIKSGLNQFLSANPGIKAIIVGNRRTDPHSRNLTEFQMTDSDWPQVMRVFPLLDWSYQEVWKFLRHFTVPYCSLYDKGYTSLGNVSNTTRNPLLQTVDRRGKTIYLPAYKLEKEEEERNGRH